MITPRPIKDNREMARLPKRSNCVDVSLHTDVLVGYPKMEQIPKSVAVDVFRRQGWRDCLVPSREPGNESTVPVDETIPVVLPR
jgi:hypothetical protein